MSIAVPFAKYSFAVVAILVSITTREAAGQNLTPLLDRIDRLERDISTLHVRMSGGTSDQVVAGQRAGNSVSKHAGTRLLARIGALEQELRTSTGGQETLNHQLQLITKRLDKLVSDIDFRLGVIERRVETALPGLGSQSASGPLGKSNQGVPIGVPPTAPVSMAPISGATSGTLGTVSAKAVEKVKSTKTKNGAGKKVKSNEIRQSKSVSILPKGTPKEQYTFAFNLLRQTNYAQAEIAFKQFIDSHGADPLAGNAHYWLGETFYVRADYRQAARIFFKSFQANPKGPKAADTLLKLGMCLAQLDKKEEACTTYEKVPADFSSSSNHLKTLLARERKRAGCK